MNRSQLPGCKLDFVREDDYVEYFVFPQVSDEVATGGDDKSVGTQLQTFLEQCMLVVNKLVKERNYIWHKDEFQLQVRTGSEQEHLLNDEIDTNTASYEIALPPHLHGVTHYGDNITDEWFVVYLLSELTRQLPKCIARVIDADGEFLLIEAAEVLPKWASPETCEQRVYLANGGLHLVQNSPDKTVKLLPVVDAVMKLQENGTLYRVSAQMQRCIDARLEEFGSGPQQQHHQIARLPLGVAALLHARPDFIAPAVRAFCERDPMDARVLRSMRYFPPELCVRSRVRFTRCLYAMIMHSQYVPDRRTGWQLGPNNNTEQYKEDLLGVKIACGFELLAAQAKESSGLDDENNSVWRTYLRSLQAKGYFRNELTGSQVYQRLLAEARTFFKNSQKRFRTAPLVGQEILSLLPDLNVEQLGTDEENNLPVNIHQKQF